VVELVFELAVELVFELAVELVFELVVELVFELAVELVFELVVERVAEEAVESDEVPTLGAVMEKQIENGTEHDSSLVGLVRVASIASDHDGVEEIEIATGTLNKCSLLSSAKAA